MDTDGAGQTAKPGAQNSPTRITAALGVAGMVLGGSVAAVSISGYSAIPAHATGIDSQATDAAPPQLDPISGDGTVVIPDEGTPKAKSGSKCWDNGTIVARAHNAVGATVFETTDQVQWCAKNGKVNDLRLHVPDYHSWFLWVRNGKDPYSGSTGYSSLNAGVNTSFKQIVSGYTYSEYQYIHATYYYNGHYEGTLQKCAKCIWTN